MARLNWCLAAVISWGKFLFACFFPLRRAKRDKVRLHKGGGVGCWWEWETEEGLSEWTSRTTSAHVVFHICIQPMQATFLHNTYHKIDLEFSSCMKYTSGGALFITKPLDHDVHTASFT